MGTYGQLIRALDMDQRPEEAHKFWDKKIGIDLHSVPWQLCKSMIGIYYRNNMLESLVKVWLITFILRYAVFYDRLMFGLFNFYYLLFFARITLYTLLA